MGCIMKLKLTLVPASSFYSNLRNAMQAEDWQKLSREVRGKANRTCQYCGWKENPKWKEYTHLHEIWEFDVRKHVQKLVGFECVCPDCHMIHHWGYAQLKGCDMDGLLYHACMVNECTPADFRDHVKESFLEWEKRGKIDWTIDLGEWSSLIKEGKANG